MDRVCKGQVSDHTIEGRAQSVQNEQKTLLQAESMLSMTETKFRGSQDCVMHTLNVANGSKKFKTTTLERKTINIKPADSVLSGQL